ncbi:valine--tRNA ligase [Helicobacter enhydrae]|uniref:Valine--tRNA ligase n=1 Tax=Helicobacter enhydrae TaxID=222136 RepID=A0A1B1U5D7_9HELI|nr:valine--tRNA ligase [Helicobacter enhydrae]ANV97968.1 valine--tRNA ligase [Helicobacter enhydrae]
MKTYSAKQIEQEIYQHTKQQGYFEIDGNHKIAQKDKHFAIMMPPPNVTGVLHIGHALTFTLQDIITRYKRMDGYITLYQPGMDHAGIATQNVVEKQLLKQGIKKEEMSRENFVKKVWEWKEESGGMILSQMEHLGISPAWSRLRFTLDEGLRNAVKTAFKQWYDEGYIYQGNYMINWCTHDGALSDIEVEYEKNQTSLYHLKYPIENSDQYLVVATTRPETFFGDTAVMINPNDSRYTHLIGQNVILPIINRKIPIIADEKVDMEFGTGCVKVTPAHDMNDYEVGKKHGLESLTIFDKNGFLNHHALEFEGLERLEAREPIVQKLQDLGFVEKIEPYTNQVGKCYRCGNIVEPYISKQWFISPKIAETAIKAVNDGGCQFFPSQWKNNYNAWMRELRPWCISRQLWWGHQIPVFYCECGEQFVSTEDNPCSCPKCGGSHITQDPDVLDTWFSSALWAFSTLGWGNGTWGEGIVWNKEDLQNFYPNSLLITGFDILFFWVARMLLAGQSTLQNLPFQDIYLHALVCDEYGRKMSKSLGNVVNPLEMIETYGADSVRFTLAKLCIQGRNIRLDPKALDLAKNFANKIFNAGNFLLLYLQQQEGEDACFKELETFKTPLGRYLASSFSQTTQKLREALDTYRFNDSTQIIEQFLWDEFCDWGIEFAKVQKESITELGSIFLSALKLLHPFMPFLSDYLYHKLRKTSLTQDDSIMITPFPKPQTLDTQIQEEFAIIKDIITSTRRLKLQLGNIEIKEVFVKAKVTHPDWLFAFLQKLTKISRCQIVDTKPQGSIGDIGRLCECYVVLNEANLQQILGRLENQKGKLEAEVAKLTALLQNQKFVANAPESVLLSNQEGLKIAQEKLQKVQEELQNLRS